MAAYSNTGNLYIPQTNVTTLAPTYSYVPTTPTYIPVSPVPVTPNYYYPPSPRYSAHNYGSQSLLPFGIGLALGTGLGYSGWSSGWGGKHRYWGNGRENHHRNRGHSHKGRR